VKAGVLAFLERPLVAKLVVERDEVFKSDRVRKHPSDVRVAQEDAVVSAAAGDGEAGVFITLVQVAEQRREEEQVAEAAVPHEQQRTAFQRLALVFIIITVDAGDVNEAGGISLELFGRAVREEDRLARGYRRAAHAGATSERYDLHRASAP